MNTHFGSGEFGFGLCDDPRLADFGQLNQQTIDHYEDTGTWVPRGNPDWSTCGDERPMAAASTAAFRELWPRVRPPAEGGMATFGQAAGIAKNALAVGMAFHSAGHEFYHLVGGIQGMIDQVIAGMRHDQEGPYPVLPAFHTDEAKERAAREAEAAGSDDQTAKTDSLFHSNGDAPVGCAYCGCLGQIAHNHGTGPFYDRLAYRDTTHILGEGNDQIVTRLIAGHRAVAAHINADYGFGRREYADSGLPIISREGTPHVSPHKTALMFNLDPHTVSKAGEIYRVDAAAAALAVRRGLRQYDLPAAAFMVSLVLDAIPTRSVLVGASSELGPHPMGLAVGKRGGTLQSALAEIAKLEKA